MADKLTAGQRQAWKRAAELALKIERDAKASHDAKDLAGLVLWLAANQG